jgi:hypothetical protein
MPVTKRTSLFCQIIKFYMIGGSTSLNLAHAAIGSFMQACKNSAMPLALMTLVSMTCSMQQGTLTEDEDSWLASLLGYLVL